jgi:hypothetical protein
MSNPESVDPAKAAGFEAKLKHLEFIQGVISRMSNSSFLFKGWAITLAAGLSAFAASSSSEVIKVALIGAIVSTVLFWGLDGYYLWIERRYRDLYGNIAAKPPNDVDLSMETDRTEPLCKWLRACLRPHLWAFYGVIVTGEIVGLVIMKGT